MHVLPSLHQCQISRLDLDSFSGRYEFSLTDRPTQLSFAAYHSSLCLSNSQNYFPFFNDAEAFCQPGGDQRDHQGYSASSASNLPACQEAGIECLPMVAETLGGLAEDAIHTIHSLGQANAAPWTLPLPPDISCHSPLARQCIPLAPSQKQQIVRSRANAVKSERGM